MILVVGATGMVGTEICRLLTTSGKTVRAMVRPTSKTEKIQAVKKLGCSTVQGDLRDAGSLKEAVKGVETIISTASSMPFAYVAGENTPMLTDRDGHLKLIDVACTEGVKRFVFISFPPMPASFPLQDAKRAVEERLHTCGLTYTILQPTFYDEVWLNPAVGFDYTHLKATLYGIGDNPISWISFRDVAQFAVACLDNVSASNATIVLGGPEAISPRKAVRVFESVTQKPFTTTTMTVEQLEKNLAGATDQMEKSFTGLMLGYARATSIDMSAVLKALPVKLTSVNEYAKSVLK